MAEIVSELSGHFIERWIERCGGVPSTEGVNRILDRSQMVRGQHVFWRVINGEFCQSSSPAVYWSHKDGLIIQVDQKRGTAVTVIVPKEKPRMDMDLHGWSGVWNGNGNGRKGQNHKKANRLPAGNKAKKRNHR